MSLNIINLFGSNTNFYLIFLKIFSFKIEKIRYFFIKNIAIQSILNIIYRSSFKILFSN